MRSCFNDNLQCIDILPVERIPSEKEAKMLIHSVESEMDFLGLVRLPVPVYGYFPKRTVAFDIVMVYIDGIAPVEEMAVTAVVAVCQTTEGVDDEVEALHTG